MKIQLTLDHDGSILVELRVRLTFLQQVQELQKKNDPVLQLKQDHIENAQTTEFSVCDDND